MSTTPAAPPLPPRTAWLAITALSLGVFGMVTVEELPIGVLTLMTDTYGVTEGRMGLTVTLPGFVAAAAALGVPLVIRSGDRRTVLVTALLLMVIGSVGSALAPTFATLLAFRTVVGVAIGSFWAIAPTVAVRLVATQHVPRATAVVFAGGSVAAVAGVPIATLIGNIAGWRAAFVVVAGVGLLNALALWRLLPNMPALGAAVTMRFLFAVARTPLVATGVIVTLALVAAHFGSFTYASPLLQDRAGVSAAGVAGVLLIGGAAGLAGNFATSAVVSRSPGAAIIMVCALLAGAHLLFAAFATTPATAAIIVALWGFAGGSIAASTQGWINQSHTRDLEAATGLNSAAFNAAIAGGALLGGAVFDASGGAVLLSTTAALCAVAVFALAAYRCSARRPA